MARGKKHIILNEKGVTLIEVIIAITILSVVFIPFFAAFIYSIKVNTKTNKMIDTTYIAQEIFEDLYFYSKEEDFAYIDSYLIGDSYTKIIKDPTKEDFDYKKIDTFNNVSILININRDKYASKNLSLVKVEIYNDTSYSDLSAKVENILLIK